MSYQAQQAVVYKDADRILNFNPPRAKYLAFAIEVSVFTLVFVLHGGSMTGGMAAAVAALLAGTILPRTIR